MIGAGKSSLAKILGEELGVDVFYESVDDNPILPLFYTASEEEIQAKRYPFLLQLYRKTARSALCVCNGSSTAPAWPEMS